MSKKKTPFPITDEVDRAMLQVYRADCKLAVIAGGHGSINYAHKSAEALRDLGNLAAIPIAAVIDQIPSEVRRLMMITAMREIPPRSGLEVYTALRRLRVNDPSEEVRAAAAEACEALRRRSHERFRRLAAVDDCQQDLMDRECVERAGKRAEASRPSDADVGIRDGAREADSSPAGH